MILTKYRIIIGNGYIETTNLTVAQDSGYEYIIIEEVLDDIIDDIIE